MGDIPLEKMNFEAVPDMAKRSAAITMKRYPILLCILNIAA
jgi:hypothetical protein